MPHPIENINIYIRIFFKVYMKNWLIIWICCFFLTLVFYFPFGSAVLDLEIEKIDKGAVVISELDNPAVYEFVITNKGADDNVEIFSLVGVSFSPKGTFNLPNGITRVEIKAYPNEDIRKREGDYSIEYQIKGQQGIFKDRMPIKVISLDNVFIVSARNIHPNDDIAEVVVENRANTNLEDVKINLKSVFFELSEEADFEQYESKVINTTIDRTKISRLIAGPYVVSGKIEVSDAETEVEGNVNYLEKEGTSVSRTSEGFLIREETITKKNEGNIPTTARIEIKKDIVSRLFTSYLELPLSSEREGLTMKYSWEKELDAGESFSVVSRTNYTFPFVVIVLIVLVVLLVKFYSATALSLNKKVSLVKTSGGEFALKIIVRIKSHKDVTDVHISDMLPGMTKLYEKYGRMPDHIDEKTRRLSWNIAKLNSGEERVVSYIIYSKLRAVGRFELPLAHAQFKRDGKTEHVSSNRAYFASETSQRVE